MQFITYAEAKDKLKTGVKIRVGRGRKPETIFNVLHYPTHLEVYTEESGSSFYSVDLHPSNINIWK